MCFVEPVEFLFLILEIWKFVKIIFLIYIKFEKLEIFNFLVNFKKLNKANVIPKFKVFLENFPKEAENPSQLTRILKFLKSSTLKKNYTKAYDLKSYILFKLGCSAKKS